MSCAQTSRRTPEGPEQFPRLGPEHTKPATRKMLLPFLITLYSGKALPSLYAPDKVSASIPSTAASVQIARPTCSKGAKRACWRGHQSPGSSGHCFPSTPQLHVVQSFPTLPQMLSRLSCWPGVSTGFVPLLKRSLGLGGKKPLSRRSSSHFQNTLSPKICWLPRGTRVASLVS